MDVTEKSTAELIGSAAGYAVNMLPEEIKADATDLAIEVEKGIQDPPDYETLVENLGELLKRGAKRDEVKEFIDNMVDVLVISEDEGFLDEVGDAVRAFNSALHLGSAERKAKRQARRDAQKGN